MPEHIVPYIPLFLVSLLVVGGVLAIFILNEVLGPKRPSASKGEAFECGNPPSEGTRRRFSVKYYVIGILFLVFDVEAVFLFPWAASYKHFLAGDFALVALVEMMLFVGILTFGLVYVWKRGALRWE